MTGPTSAPHGERAGTPGAAWGTELRPTGEQYVPDGEPEPTANRATRRAARRAQKRSDGHTELRQGPAGPQEAREGPWASVSGPNSTLGTGARRDAQNGSQSPNPAPPTRTETR
jgi:hypothetical protein